MYLAGAKAREVAEHFGVHHTTALAHLKRRPIPLRRRGLDPTKTPEAAALYEQGLTLLEAGRRFGVGQGTVRRALDSSGVPIRPRGRRCD